MTSPSERIDELIATTPGWQGETFAMSDERNLALVRRYFTECVSGASGPDQQSALSVVDELLSPDFVMLYSNETDAEAAHGRERHKEFLVEHARSFPDDHWTVEALVADDDMVACQWRIQAIHAKTGNPIDVRAADFFRVRDGRLVELRRFLDFSSFRRQLRPHTARG
jgi:ketosteroid isomerase-like protein